MHKQNQVIAPQKILDIVRPVNPVDEKRRQTQGTGAMEMGTMVMGTMEMGTMEMGTMEMGMNEMGMNVLGMNEMGMNEMGPGRPRTPRAT